MAELFSAFGIEWQLLLAQAVNFGIVLFALTYFLYRPVLRLLAERQEKIAKGVQDAEAATEARAATDAERMRIITAAEKQAEDVVRHAADEGKRERDLLVQSGQVRADGIVKDAEERAEELKHGAIKESEQEIARAAVLAAEKILKKS